MFMDVSPGISFSYAKVDLSDENIVKVTGDPKGIVDTLHSSGFVRGDVRDKNVFIEYKGKP